MRLYPSQTLQSIADLIGCSFEGDPSFPVTGINEIHKVEAGDLVFVDHPKYYEKALNCAATTILINQKVDCPPGKALIFSEDPFRDYNKLTRHFGPWQLTDSNRGIEVTIGEGTRIHPTAVIGNYVTIGKACIIHPGVVISDHVTIGDHCIIHANSVIGGDAFYYKKRPEGFDKMHTCGEVIIEDEVEIGALCTIDRGVSGDTRIGRGSKLDNQVHVGHDTVIGERCLFAAQVGIAGCVVIGNGVTLWGQVGIPSDRRLADGTVVLGQSGVLGDTEAGKTYFGSPAEESRAKWKELALIRRLPEVFEKLGLK
jgi:UDP-3-O-[3-hydroxymyristoyl] glucosamine N-acyltransferase